MKPDSCRRMTFGKHNPAGEMQRQTFVEEQSEEMDEQVLDQINSGLGRLTRAITPRLERYKVELFIHLCEMLESEGNPENFEAAADGEESSEEDVYGSGTYSRPRMVSSDQFGQYYAQQ